MPGHEYLQVETIMLCLQHAIQKNLSISDKIVVSDSLSPRLLVQNEDSSGLLQVLLELLRGYGLFVAIQKADADLPLSQQHLPTGIRPKRAIAACNPTVKVHEVICVSKAHGGAAS